VGLPEGCRARETILSEVSITTIIVDGLKKIISFLVVHLSI
jgi:hypothetical protein